MEYSSFIKAGGNLAIESVQDKDSYTSHNESKGMGLSIGSMKKTIDNNKMKSSLKGGLAVGMSKSNIDSTYESVTNQAGITAGSQGYEVSVKDTTHLKGGLIDSHASQDKNTLTTGTLVWEDIENKADYKATASGRNYGASWSPKETVGDKKVGGLTGGTSPVKSQPVKGKAESTTKSAVSEGAITITDKEHQKQDISDLNRDTKNTLNQLEKIFDKEKVQERQALANEFAKLGAEKIGDIAKEKGWDKNDTRRTLLHGLLGGITAKLGGNNVLSGVMAEGGMESLQPLLDNFLKDHPDMREEVSSIFGYCAGKLFGGDGDVGAATAWNGTKFNWLTHDQMDEYAEEMKQTKTEKEQETVIEKWLHINALQGDNWLNAQGNGDFTDLSGEKGTLVRADPLTAPGSTFDWSSSASNTLNGMAWDKSGEILASTGLTWGTANWFEANYDLSREEAETIGKNISSATTKVWGRINYLKSVSDNHQRYKSWQTALKADAYDTLPISFGILGTAGGTWLGGPYWGLLLGGASAGFTSDYVERVKLEWEKNEHDQNTSATNNGGK